MLGPVLVVYSETARFDTATETSSRTETTYIDEAAAGEHQQLQRDPLSPKRNCWYVNDDDGNIAKGQLVSIMPPIFPSSVAQPL